ncbi:MAG: PEP-CTERM sorting domain-containing protein [Isosphaeraceae bacterium]|nr:PEP-CTERM sorting domain-containing protein [Isosphaeraceae bacterium]
MKIRILAAALVLAFSSVASATEIAVWNFNDATDSNSTFAGEVVAMLTVDKGAGILTTNVVEANIRDFAGSVINASTGDVAGQAISFQGGDLGTSLSPVNNGRNFTVQVSTLGLEDIIVSMAVRRTASGFNNLAVEYSTDNMVFAAFGNIVPTDAPITAAGALQTIDLSAIAAVENVASLYVRFTMTGASTATGNIRLDNLRVEGTEIPTSVVPEPTTIASAALGFVAFVVARRRRAA